MQYFFFFEYNYSGNYADALSRYEMLVDKLRKDMEFAQSMRNNEEGRQIQRALTMLTREKAELDMIAREAQHFRTNPMKARDMYHPGSGMFFSVGDGDGLFDSGTNADDDSFGALALRR